MITQTQITLLINIALFLFSCVNFWLARKGDIKEDTEGTLKANLKLDSLCASMADTRVDIKGLVDATRKVTEKQIKLEQEMLAVWKRIDENRKLGNENHEKIEELYRMWYAFVKKEEENNK